MEAAGLAPHALNRAGHGDGGDHAAQWLTAYRCPACRTDEVEDRTTRELWVLEDSDYGDDGSYA